MQRCPGEPRSALFDEARPFVEGSTNVVRHGAESGWDEAGNQWCGASRRTGDASAVAGEGGQDDGAGVVGTYEVALPDDPGKRGVDVVSGSFDVTQLRAQGPEGIALDRVTSLGARESAFGDEGLDGEVGPAVALGQAVAWRS